MFNAYNVENDSEKLLVEIDVRTLISLMCCFGESTKREIEQRLILWGLTDEEARDASEYTTGQYSEIKRMAIEKYLKYSKDKFGP